MLKSKIRATIGNKGDIIGWPDGKEVVGSIALAAKHSLIRAIPYIMPLEDSSSSLYRFVLEHGNFGIHHTSIAIDANLDPQVTSLYDWQEACIVPALLSDPEVRVIPIDLIAGDLGEACITRAPAISTATDREEYTAWAEHYFQVRGFYPFFNDPDLPVVIFSNFMHKRQTTRRLSKQGKMLVICGSHCAVGTSAEPKHFSDP